MSKIIVIVEKLKDWNSYYPVEQLMTPQDYLVNWVEPVESGQRIKVINLCRSYRYQSYGYYCSLLAEARGHSVIPSVKTINDLSRSFLYSLDTEELNQDIQSALRSHNPGEGFSINVHFGHTQRKELQGISRQLFDLFPAPILHVNFEWEKRWKIESLHTGSLNALSESEEDHFATALDDYAGKVWRKPRSKKRYRYDLAILHNPLDPLPPSDAKALKHFKEAGKELDVSVELLEKKDFARVAEYDALFIRETTALNHHTYRFAKKAEAEGLIVIDDSRSILRCTNKIYMHNLLSSQKISAPKTIVLMRDNPELIQQAIQEIGFPMIIKIPDGAFSKGVFKIQDREHLGRVTDECFKKTALLLAQEFCFTEFDWRIGVLNNRPLYACKYYMTKGHWQIYDHAQDKEKDKTGDVETLPLSKVPKHVLSTALKITREIGDSLYGVDLKEKDAKALVIEVNDNPNIDAGIEDAVLGDELYVNILREFVRKIEESK